MWQGHALKPGGCIEQASDADKRAQMYICRCDAEVRQAQEQHSLSKVTTLTASKRNALSCDGNAFQRNDTWRFLVVLLLF